MPGTHPTFHVEGVGSGGGGGAYGTNGGNGGSNGGQHGGGSGGIAYGDTALAKLYFGSGGDGAPGGGIIFVSGHTISFGGTISSQGAEVGDPGGSGAGGAIRIEGYDISLNTMNALGGGGCNGDPPYGCHGYGGNGRIAVYYQHNTPTISSSSPTAYVAALGSGTATPTATPTGTPIVQTPQPTQAGWVGTTYTYTTAHPHAVTAAGGNSYTYDQNGNMTCRVESNVSFIQTFNAEDRLSSVGKLASGTCASPGLYQAVWNFSYDGDGTRVAQNYTPYDENGNAGTDVLTVYFMGGVYEVTGSTITKYYSIAGQTVAMNDGSGLKYLLTDHLGSVVAITNANGSVLSQTRYLPFGGVRTGVGTITTTDFAYTGQRNVAGMGLMDYHARFYDESLGRFIQPDTIIPSYANPQDLNRFAYVINNPIGFNDPSGNSGENSGYMAKRKAQKIAQSNAEGVLKKLWAQILAADTPPPPPPVPIKNPSLGFDIPTDLVAHCENGQCRVESSMLPETGKLRYDPLRVNVRDLIFNSVNFAASFTGLNTFTKALELSPGAIKVISTYLNIDSAANSFQQRDLAGEVLATPSFVPGLTGVYASGASLVKTLGAGFYFEPVRHAGPPVAPLCGPRWPLYP